MSNLNSVTPTWVTPIRELYNANISPGRFTYRNYYLLSPTPQLQYRLDFLSITDSDYAVLLAQWRDVSGNYSAFDWNTVPSYIESGATMRGRWIGQPEINPKARSWDISLVFEKDLV